MLRLLVFLSLIYPLSALSEGTEFKVTAEQWASPRHGQLVAQMPSLRELVAALERSENGRVLIRHPVSEEGSIWAQELRGWLISLGISSAQLQLAEGSSSDDVIDLLVQKINE